LVWVNVRCSLEPSRWRFTAVSSFPAYNYKKLYSPGPVLPNKKNHLALLSLN
jgi:hypothetical protein